MRKVRYESMLQNDVKPNIYFALDAVREGSSAMATIRAHLVREQERIATVMTVPRRYYSQKHI